MVTVLVAHVPQFRVDVLAALDDRTGPHFLVTVVAGLLTVAMLSRLLGELTSR